MAAQEFVNLANNVNTAKEILGKFLNDNGELLNRYRRDADHHEHGQYFLEHGQDMIDNMEGQVYEGSSYDGTYRR